MEFNANQGASRITRDHTYVQAALAELIGRAGRLGGNAGKQLVREALATRLTQWLNRISRMSGAQLGYKDARDGQTVGLLSFPERGSWSTFTCLNSLRDVEPTVNLILNEYGMDREDERAWPAAALPPRGATAPLDDEAEQE